jgi:hypothetical protein
MEGSVLSFLKAEWKVSDTCSAHWASSFFYLYFLPVCEIRKRKIKQLYWSKSSSLTEDKNIQTAIVSYKLVYEQIGF